MLQEEYELATVETEVNFFVMLCFAFMESEATLSTSYCERNLIPTVVPVQLAWCRRSVRKNNKQRESSGGVTKEGCLGRVAQGTTDLKPPWFFAQLLLSLCLVFRTDFAPVVNDSSNACNRLWCNLRGGQNRVKLGNLSKPVCVFRLCAWLLA